MLKSYFYGLLNKYLSFYVRPDDSILEVDPSSDDIIKNFTNANVLYLRSRKSETTKNYEISEVTESPDYILIHGHIHFEHDIQLYLGDIHKLCSSKTRIIITNYSSLWKPILNTLVKVGLRKKEPELNWLAHEDIDNLLLVSDFQRIRRDSKILLPVYIPIISGFVNKVLAPLPFFRWFNLLNITIAKPLIYSKDNNVPSVSVVVAARNEEGNIDNIVKRIPKMGPDDELIFVEGGSTDNTWGKILEVSKDNPGIIAAQQDGKGKGDAVRKGFALAKKDILIILDADLSVPPEDLSKFYEAIASGKGEFINGSRLVYPMEEKAMRFLNMVGNKFFALAFSFILGQRFKDTLCGTKVMTRDNYLRLEKDRSYFGDFDPFGDFDLIFGAARMGLKIVEIPIVYRERVYGETNISRWSHGILLLRMVVFAARKFKFL